MRVGLFPKMDMDGKSCSRNVCAAISAKILGCTLASLVFTTFIPWGTWYGGREKAPAAICRKVAEAKIAGNHEIEIWGSGNQTRSFMFIDDCIEGIRRIMDLGILEPINLGSSEAVNINQLVDMVEDIAGIRLKRRYDLSAPEGVNGRNSDNTMIKKYVQWEPRTPLRTGLEKTYALPAPLRPFGLYRMLHGL